MGLDMPPLHWCSGLDPSGHCPTTHTPLFHLSFCPADAIVVCLLLSRNFFYFCFIISICHIILIYVHCFTLLNMLINGAVTLQSRLARCPTSAYDFPVSLYYESNQFMYIFINFDIILFHIHHLAREMIFNLISERRTFFIWSKDNFGKSSK